MPNDDQVNMRYYGLINSEESHIATQFRVHWICKQVRGKRVLDIGCSQGISSILLGREGFDVIGIDIEDKSIQYAISELKKESRLVQKNVNFLLRDASSIGTRLGKFDSIILGEVLEHFAHPEKLLDTVHKALNDDGRVIITVPFGYHPFYDHKQTFYVGSLSRLLDPYFEELNISVHYKYICYVGQKRERIKQSPRYTVEQFMTWLDIDEENFLLIEQKKDEMLNERKKRLEQKEAQILKLQQQIREKQNELDALKLKYEKFKEQFLSLTDQIKQG